MNILGVVLNSILIGVCTAHFILTGEGLLGVLWGAFFLWVCLSENPNQGKGA